MLYRLFPLLFAGLLLTEAAFAPASHAAARAPEAVAAVGSVADLARPPAPLSGYRPHFVHQTQNNCAFASAAMLIDKWTGGRKRPSQSRLRWASRVPTTEGVGIGQLARAVGAGAGIKLAYSPGGGDSMTFAQLMDRLGKGGAAVVAGSYSRLPSHYQRWARDYAALGATRSGHALYVERYEPGRSGGRVWMMDPLASGSSYDGEWISASALRRFTWHSSKGLVHAAATPAPPPLAGLEFGAPAVENADGAMAGREVTISLPVDVRAGWSRPENLALSVVWTPTNLDPDPESLANAYLAEQAAAAEAAAQAATAAAAGEEPPPAKLDRPQLGEDDDLGAGALGRPELSADAEPTDAVVPENLEVEREGAAQAVPAGEAAAQAPAADETAAATTGSDDHDAGPGKPSKPVIVRLDARDGRLTGSLRAPDRSGEYRLSFELRQRDGSAFPSTEAPRLADANIRLRGPLALRYGSLEVSDGLVQGSLTTVSLQVSNLGSEDWTTERAVDLSATWQTTDGSWTAAAHTFELVSGDSERFTFETIVPTGTDEGSLILELVTSEGIPFSVYGFEPVSVSLAFGSPLETQGTSAPQE